MKDTYQRVVETFEMRLLKGVPVENSPIGLQQLPIDGTDYPSGPRIMNRLISTLVHVCRTPLFVMRDMIMPLATMKSLAEAADADLGDWLSPQALFVRNLKYERENQKSDERIQLKKADEKLALARAARIKKSKPKPKTIKTKAAIGRKVPEWGHSTEHTLTETVQGLLNDPNSSRTDKQSELQICLLSALVADGNELRKAVESLARSSATLPARIAKQMVKAELKAEMDLERAKQKTARAQERANWAGPPSVIHMDDEDIDRAIANGRVVKRF